MSTNLCSDEISLYIAKAFKLQSSYRNTIAGPFINNFPKKKRKKTEIIGKEKQITLKLHNDKNEKTENHSHHYVYSLATCSTPSTFGVERQALCRIRPSLT
jgi:hypothetical protein